MILGNLIRVLYFAAVVTASGFGEITPRPTDDIKVTKSLESGGITSTLRVYGRRSELLVSKNEITGEVFIKCLAHCVACVETKFGMLECFDERSPYSRFNFGDSKHVHFMFGDETTRNLQLRLECQKAILSRRLGVGSIHGMGLGLPPAFGMGFRPPPTINSLYGGAEHVLYTVPLLKSQGNSFSSLGANQSSFPPVVRPLYPNDKKKEENKEAKGETREREIETKVTESGKRKREITDGSGSNKRANTSTSQPPSKKTKTNNAVTTASNATSTSNVSLVHFGEITPKPKDDIKVTEAVSDSGDMVSLDITKDNQAITVIKFLGEDDASIIIATQGNCIAYVELEDGNHLFSDDYDNTLDGKKVSTSLTAHFVFGDGVTEQSMLKEDILHAQECPEHSPRFTIHTVSLKRGQEYKETKPKDEPKEEKKAKEETKSDNANNNNSKNNGNNRSNISSNNTSTLGKDFTKVGGKGGLHARRTVRMQWVDQFSNGDCQIQDNTIKCVSGDAIAKMTIIDGGNSVDCKQANGGVVIIIRGGEIVNKNSLPNGVNGHMVSEKVDERRLELELMQDDVVLLMTPNGKSSFTIEGIMDYLSYSFDPTERGSLRRSLETIFEGAAESIAAVTIGSTAKPSKK